MYILFLAALWYEVNCKVDGNDTGKIEPGTCKQICSGQRCSFLSIKSDLLCLVTGGQTSEYLHKDIPAVSPEDTVSKASFRALKIITTPSKTIQCGKTPNCGRPPKRPNMAVVVQDTSYLSEAMYVCAQKYTQTGGQGTSVCEVQGLWTEPTLKCQVDCGRPDQFTRKGYIVQYDSTTYKSVVVIQCGLEKYSPRSTRVRSVCIRSGQWSRLSRPYPRCIDIRNKRGHKALPESRNPVLTCRNVISTVPDVVSACRYDEILTGCTAMSKIRGGQTKGSFVSSLKCRTKRYSSDVPQTVARCCRIPGLQCEYLRSPKEVQGVKCYKNFQLIDCSCWRQHLPPGPCPSLPTNDTCGGAGVRAWRYATCCNHNQFTCYIKTANGKDSSRRSKLTIACGRGELMTACSGYNTGRGIQSAIVQESANGDVCIVNPGFGSMNTLIGYVSCCGMKEKIV